MGWFENLLVELTPLYIIALLGFVAGKMLKVDTKSISTLTIYLISPVVFFLTIAQLDFSYSALLAPLTTFVLSVIFAVLLLKIMPLYERDEKTPYAGALAVGTSNWGYFGVPIAFALFEPQVVAAYMMIGFGLQLFENTFGIYFISRGTMSPRDSFFNIFRLPPFYAIVVGLILSALNTPIPQQALDLLELFKGAYTVMGMMMIGLGLAALTRFTVDLKFVATMFGVRFLLWPALAIGLVALDQRLNILGELYHAPMLVFSVMPMAANNIAFAAQFDMNPGKMSVAVLLTTLFAIIYLPVALYVFGLT